MSTPTIPYYPITHDDGLDIVSALNDIQCALNIPTQIIAGNFDSSVAYAVGDYCIYNGTLYRFTSAHSAGTWNPSHVVAVVVGSELKTKQDSLSWDTAPTSGGTNPMQSGAIYAHEPFQVTGTASAGSSVTFTDSRINSEHWKVPKNGIYFGTPANVTSGVRWVTNITSHTITLTATFAGSTTVEIDMLWFQ